MGILFAKRFWLLSLYQTISHLVDCSIKILMCTLFVERGNANKQTPNLDRRGKGIEKMAFEFSSVQL